MKGPGILWMLQVALGMSMAGPMFVVGAISLQSGNWLFGALMFSFGLIALFAPNYLFRRIGGPRTWIRRRLGRERDDDASTTDAEPNDTSTPTGGRVSSLLERVRRR